MHESREDRNWNVPIEPSERDLQRVLVADYAVWDEIDLWMSESQAAYAQTAWGVAIRRAIAAESEVDRLKQEVKYLKAKLESR